MPDLNSSQQMAVNHKSSRLLIVAGPGTGKTHTLTHRIVKTAEHLVQGQKILAITFTNKASDEMNSRLTAHLSNAADCVTIKTFHKFCVQILREYHAHPNVPKDFKIASTDDIEHISKVIWPDKKQNERKLLLNKISAWKATDYDEAMPDEVRTCTAHLRKEGLLDFDDLLLETFMLLKDNGTVLKQVQATFRHVFVDEYQDINAIQHKLLKLLVGNHGNITAIGDPNQAIYGFRGSDVRYFEQFCNDFPGSVTLSLSENYRSAQSIVSASGQMIAKEGNARVPALTLRRHENPVPKDGINTNRSESTLSKPRPNGRGASNGLTAQMYLQGRLTIYEAATDRAEAEYVVHTIEKMVGGTSMFSQDSGRVTDGEDAERSFGDIAVLYRLNSQSVALKQAFDRSGIPCHVSDKQSGNDLDDICPQRNSDVSLEAEKVSLMTLHAAKGLEFPCVFIVGCEQNILPLNLEEMTADPREERRLLYVGMTRAKEWLYLVHAQRRFLYGKTYRNSPSVLLNDIEEELKEYAAVIQRKRKPDPNEDQLTLF